MIITLKNGAYEYDEKDFLGQGAFAKVYKGIITKNNRIIAVRLLALDLLKKYGQKIKGIIEGQVAVLKELSQYDSIDILFMTRIYDCFLTQNHVVMILQFCPDGNLQDVIAKRGAIPQKQALQIIYQLARCIQFIAKKKIVHRDIKPDNIFLKKQKNHTLYKLGDFGFAVKKQLNNQTVGTPIFMSPQIFKGQAYGSEVDVWAFGLLCHYILFKQHYFIAGTQRQVQKRVLNCPYQLKNHQIVRISDSMADMLKCCLQKDKQKRLKASQLTSHPVFDSVKDNIQEMAQQIINLDSKFQSKLTLSSPKGMIANLVMKYQFLFNLARAMSDLDPSSPTSLYMVKYNLVQLNKIRKLYQQKQNFINHSAWDEFVNSIKYSKMQKFIESIFTMHQKCFFTEFKRHMQIIQTKYGPHQAQTLKKNLGSGSYGPKQISMDLYKNWMNKFKQKNTLEMQVKAYECNLAYAIYHDKQIELDFMNIEHISLEEKKNTIRQALNNLSGRT